MPGRRHGVVLIFDEVVTGFRFHWRGAQGLTGVVPDLATYGKVLGGGYPLAAVAGSRYLIELADPRQGPASFSGSQHGNAVAAAAGLATLDALRVPGTYERLGTLATLMGTTLRRALDGVGGRGRVVVLGPVWHLCPLGEGDGPFPDHASSLPRDPVRAAAVVTALVTELAQLGVLAFPRGRRGYLRGYLSLAHSEADVALTGAHLQEALARIAPLIAQGG